STAGMSSEAGAFFTSDSLDSNCTIKYIYIGRVNSCRTGTCSVDEDLAEYFDYIILFNTDKSVVQVKVFNYQATHGQEITAKSWLKQFIGYQGQKELKVNKDIDSISGATISTYAITEDINKRSAILLCL
nr:FMN-binding protein [Bacteroidales bacterium]